MDSESYLVGNLVLDSEGYSHFTYVPINNPAFANVTSFAYVHLMYASWNGTAWRTSTVDANMGNYGCGSLVLDSNDNPHISYFNGGIKYATGNGSAWSIQTVDSTNTIFGNQEGSLALDRSAATHT